MIDSVVLPRRHTRRGAAPLLVQSQEACRLFHTLLSLPRVTTAEVRIMAATTTVALTTCHLHLTPNSTPLTQPLKLTLPCPCITAVRKEELPMVQLPMPSLTWLLTQVPNPTAVLLSPSPWVARSPVALSPSRFTSRTTWSA